MRTGIFVFGGVEMPDAGPGAPAPTDRRYSDKEMWSATEALLDLGVLTDELGFDSFWLTEHHFQYEGYEVVPNGILFSAILSERTERLRIGQMFNVVGQWHPLRLAEDFATLHNVSGGRGILGLGRGTVPREAEVLGTRIGSFDNPDAAAADAQNRAQFEEAVDLMLAAYAERDFAHHGTYYDVPPPGIPDRGGFVETLSLVPRPLHPVEVWQAVTSPPTLQRVPERGFGAVFWLAHRDFVRQRFERYGEIHEATHGGALAPGAKRMLVLNVRVGDTHEKAMAAARPYHDEFWKFLGPYGWSRGYKGADGKPAAAGLIPSLEESVAQGTWIVGTADEVGEGLARYRDELHLEDLVLFPNALGDSYASTRDQLQRLAADVLPGLG